MRLLIIGNLGGELVAASKIAVKSGAKVVNSPSVESALSLIRSGKPIDLIMIDVNYDIKDLIYRLECERISIEVIACGIESDSEKAVAAICAGAREYLSLPPEEDLIAAILSSIAQHDEASGIVTTSLKMQNIFNIAKQVATSEATVLITGESGTGKEVMAQHIHKMSNRKNIEMIAINCAAIPEQLLESELFGHEKGAFTGATERRIGKFEAAHGSTLLLDEISEMDLKLQAKLLRVLQEKEVVRVGGNVPVKTDIRIIATSNRDLAQYAKEGHFRQDLYYRLNVINITMPTLRDRLDDIEQLAADFVVKYAKLNCVPPKKISQDALNKLRSYTWPGNIRELENCMHRSLLLSRNDVINAHDISLLAEPVVTPSNQNDMSLEYMERQAIVRALDRSSGDHLKASAVLGISIRSLQDKLKQHKIA